MGEGVAQPTARRCQEPHDGVIYFSLLMQSVEDARRNGLEVFVNFLHNRYSELPELDVTTLIVPYTCGKHWSVYILSDYGYFHLDSMISCGLHVDFTIRICLRKCGVHENDIMTIVRCGQRHSPHTRESKSVYPNKIRVGPADFI